MKPDTHIDYTIGTGRTPLPHSTGPASSSLNWDVRHMSPRDLADFSYELYLEGILDLKDYQMLSAHSELHPNYNATIGILTGRYARPNLPRDMIAEWEDRVSYARENGNTRKNNDFIMRGERILKILKAFDDNALPVNF